MRAVLTPWALLLVLGIAFAPNALAQESDDAPASRQTVGAVEEIVVRARRRDEFLEDTPVAVTALSPRTLSEHVVVQLDDVQDLVPNAVFRLGPAGSQNIRIRGVGTGNRSLAFDPGVGIYVDGVFLPRAIGTIIDIIDVEQIEVLRGPQGTLFGKNTVGGAVNVTTIKPTDVLEGSVLVRPGNLGTIDTRLMMNVPIVEDTLAARFAFASTNRDGYVYNRFRDDGLSDRHSIAFLGSLRYRPVDDLTIDVTGTWAHQRSRSLGGQCVFVREVGTAALAPPGFYPNCRESQPFDVEADTLQIANDETYGVWGIANWDVGDAGPLENLNVRSLTSWREQRPRYRFDLDNTKFFVAQISTAGGSIADGEPGFQRQVSQELQANGQALDGRLSYVGGFFAFWEDGNQNESVFALPDTLNQLTQSNISIDNFTWALFGQATADLTDWMSLTGGIRYTEDTKRLDFEQGDPRADFPASTQSGGRTFPAWTPMGSLALTAPEDWIYEAQLDHLMGYFTYSRGFKGGGFNAVSGSETAEGVDFSFEPETLDNFELGLKTIAADGRLTLNLAFFLGKYDDIQETSFRDIGDDSGNLQRLTLNAAEATIQGIEAEVQLLPAEGWQVSGNIGYLDARYDSFPDGFSDLDGQPIDRSGQRLRGVPELQSFLAVQYSFALDDLGPEWLEGWLTPRVEWTYQGSILMLGPEVPAATQRGVNLLNARLSYDFAGDRAQVALWAKNLTDQAYFDSALPLVSTFGTFSRYYEPPRTFGAEISYRFGS